MAIIPTDPNVIFLCLVVGLWLGAAAIKVPGTGVFELVALGGTGLSLLALLDASTNWLAVLAVVIGVLSFLLIPFFSQRYAGLAVAGLILQVVGGLTMFSAKAGVSPILVLATTAASLLYYRFGLLPILEAHHKRHTPAYDETIIGAHGHVQRALDPVGTVHVRGETWTARADDAISAGTEVVVLERDGLTLYVEPIKQKRIESAS